MIRQLNALTLDSRDDIGLDDLRRQVLYLSTLACMVGTYVLMLAFAQSDDGGWWVSGAIATLYLLATIAFLVGRLHTKAGSCVLMVGFLGLATAAVWVPTVAWTVALAPLIVIFASTFFGLLGSLVAGVLISLDFILVQYFGAPISTEEMRIVLVLTWANVLLVRLSTEPTRMALDWSWRECQRAEREADRARRHQAELGQTVKSLNVAQDHLEQLNGELEKARRVAEEARRIKSEFAAAISHELRTPLNLIIGFSEMMIVAPARSYDDQLPDCYAADIQTIYQNASHISSLIDDILDLSQIDAQRLGLRKEPTSIYQIIEAAVSGIAARFHAQGLTLEVQASPQLLPPLLVDPTRVRQVIINLLVNALRFTDQGGVVVSVRHDEHDVVIAVADTGVGIATEDVPHIFDSFRQSGDTNRRRGGSGLGLTVSRRFVEMHGGSMWAESELGVGSTFYFSLPTAENIISSPYAAPTLPPAARGFGNADREVVVLDEGGEAARLLQRHLDGYTVVPVGDVAQVRRLVEQRSIRAVIVCSPALRDAWRQAQVANRSLQQLPWISCQLQTSQSTALELGVAEYLPKPFTRDRLRAALRWPGREVRSILVTDDDPDMVRLLERMIRSCSKRFCVLTASDGAECLRLLREVRPDALIVDLLMPRVDGYAVIKSIREDEALRSVRVIAMSASGGQHREGLTLADDLTVSRMDGLTVGEAVGCLKGALDALLVPARDSYAEPRAESLE